MAACPECGGAFSWTRGYRHAEGCSLRIGRADRLGRALKTSHEAETAATGVILAPSPRSIDVHGSGDVRFCPAHPSEPRWECRPCHDEGKARAKG